MMKKLLFLILTTLVITSCSKSDDTSSTPTNSFSGVKFKGNGVTYEWQQSNFGFRIVKVLPQGTGQNYPVGGYELRNLMGLANGIAIKMPIGTTLSTGTFTVTIYPYLNSIEYGNPTSCTATITKASNGLCSGTFSGTAYSYPGNQQLSITEGQFTDIPVIN